MFLLHKFIRFCEKKEICLIITFTLLGFFLRSLGYFNITLAGDFEYHWSVASEIVKQEKIYMLGPKASVDENLFLGPFYYYFLSFIYILSNGDYKIAIIIFSFINSLSIPIFYKLCRKWFDNNQSLLLCLFYSTSAYLIEVGNFPWNPYILPSLIIITLLVLEKTKENYLYNIHYGILLSLLIQAHASSLFLVIYLVIEVIKINKINFFRKNLLIIAGFILSMLPWFIIDISSNFEQSQRAINLITNRKTENCDLIYWLSHHGNGEKCFHYFRNSLFILKQFSAEVFNTQKIVFALPMILLIFNFFRNIKFKKEILWFVIPWSGFLIYSSNVYHHYFLQFFPLPIFALGQLIFDLNNSKKYYIKLISYLIIIITLIINITSYLNNLFYIRG